MSRKIRKYDARTFYETISFGGASFSPDENRILISSDANGIFNLYSQPVGGGSPKQLTHSKTDAVIGIDFFPGDERILYSSDQGGNELNHLFVLEEDGEIVDLTPGENLKASFLDWSSDESCLWVLTNERDSKYFDLYRYDVRNYEREMIYENTGVYGIVESVSTDECWVALLKIRNNANNDIYVWDARNPGNPPRLVTPHMGDVDHEVSDFSPDSGELLYLSNGGGEFMSLWSYNLESEEHRLVEEADWDIMYSYFSRNGLYRITGVNVDARTEITVLDLKEERIVTLPDIPRGDITGVKVSKSGRYMAFYVNGDTSPSNLHVLEMESGEHRRLTESLNPAIDETDLVDAEVVLYQSFDGLRIPALLYKPHAASQEHRVPAVVYVHGGPGGQTRLGYSAERQFLVNQGYAILAVNNRGSSGYGKTFYHLDDKRHGDVDLKDCVWGRRFLEGLNWVDGSRVAIMGGSYGGYMVAAALAFEPEAFDVGIDIFGVTNWVRTLRSIPSWWEVQREALYSELGDPFEEEEMLRAKSPLFHAGNIVRPMLVIQGRNDPRVLQVESDEIVEAIRANEIPVEYVIFPDEGHGFRVKANRITAAEAYLKFLEEYLVK
jgi:dipeptidyl aminopeptidase/acylaminoacyl peptidase